MKKLVVILVSVAFLAVSCGQTSKKNQNTEVQTQTTENEIVGKQDSVFIEEYLEHTVVQSTKIEVINENSVLNDERAYQIYLAGKTHIKFEVDYASNKDLLNAVLLFDFIFPHGDWRIEHTKEWYSEIKSNNFWIVEQPTLSWFRQSYFKTNSTVCFMIIDGSWCISLYKTSDNSFIAVSHEMIGDGNIVNIFEMKENQIVENLSFESLFGNFDEQIKLTDSSQECVQKLIDIEFEHYFWVSDFNFSDGKTARISSAWLIEKDEFEDCLKGNSILYKFNPATKKFEIEKIYWE